MTISTEVTLGSQQNLTSKSEAIEMAYELLDNCEQECSARGFTTPVCRDCRAAVVILNLEKEIGILRRLQNLEVKR